MKPFAPDAQVLGNTILDLLSQFPPFTQKNMLTILAQEGIENLEMDTWYDLKKSLAFYNKIALDFGPNTLFKLGKAIPEMVTFPPEIDSIESALQSIDIAYNINHRNGYVGFYKMVSHNVEEKKIIMQCYNPYPCNLDRGILICIARKFKSGIRVVIDETKPNKEKGGDESWYIISYR